MSQCWSTGGPAWLFDIALVAGFAAVLSICWWISAWSEKPIPSQPRSRAVVEAGTGLLLVAVFVMTSPAPSIADVRGWLAVAAVAAVTIGMVAVYRRRVQALSTGVELGRGWQQAAATLKWATPALTGTLVLAAVGAVIAMLVTAHPVSC
jgi:hypothetical protein